MKILREIAIVATLAGLPVTAFSQTQAAGAVAAVTAADHAPLLLEAGTGRVVSLHAAAANVFVADPKIAEYVRPAPRASSCSAWRQVTRQSQRSTAAGHIIAQATTSRCSHRRSGRCKRSR